MGCIFFRSGDREQPALLCKTEKPTPKFKFQSLKLKWEPASLRPLRVSRAKFFGATSEARPAILNFEFRIFLRQPHQVP